MDWTTKGAVMPAKDQGQCGSSLLFGCGKQCQCPHFQPEDYWLCAATDISIKVWDLENKSVLDELHSTAPPKRGIPWCVSLQWSAGGNVLFAGATDGKVHVYTMLGAYDPGLPRIWLVSRHQQLVAFERTTAREL